MPKLNLSQTVIQLLKENPEKQFTTKQIAEEIYKIKPEECEAKLKRSKKLKTYEELIKQLGAEIGADKTITKDSLVKITTDRPRKFYYSNKSDEEEIAEIEQNKESKSLEEEIYPLVCDYLYNVLGLYPKRIDEKTSSNTKGKNGNKWLHPDIVGIKNLTENWNDKIKVYAEVGFYTKVSLWSFEVKLKINMANVRECFFQAVSNSSWANFAYLVVLDVSYDAMEELKILCPPHKIGVIKLDKDDVNESQIIIPASKREKVDLDMMNRIAGENGDFKKYIDAIVVFNKSGKIVKEDWDLPAV